jgi:probable F420-dependent oxidoreductase
MGVPAGPTFGASFGSFGAGLAPGAEILDWAEEVERLGYDVLWFRDHLLWHSPVLEPFTALGALAARTRRIRLGPGVLLLPLRHPAHVAKAVASLDYLSGGRAVLGVGVGGEFPREYEAAGVPLAERGRRADESLEAIRALWTRAPASYRGRFFAFADVVMEPRPVQVPHPPIWVGGRSEAAVRRAARHGDGWLAYFVTPERLREGLLRAAGYRSPNGDGATPLAGGVVLYVCLAPDREAARREAARYLSLEYRQPFERLVERYCALGPAAECAETIQRFVAAGARHITLIPTGSPAFAREQLRALAAEVLPLVRDAGRAEGARA